MCGCVGLAWLWESVYLFVLSFVCVYLWMCRDGCTVHVYVPTCGGLCSWVKLLIFSCCVWVCCCVCVCVFVCVGVCVCSNFRGMPCAWWMTEEHGWDSPTSHCYHPNLAI